MNRWTTVLLSMLVAVFLVVSFTSGALAQESKAFQASLTPKIAVHDPDVMIEGVSLGIWSENPQKAFALGFVSGSTGHSKGFSWSFLVNYADSYSGVHWAPVNYTKMDFTGWQSGMVNITKQGFKGFQSGFVNYAGVMTGLQLGLVNYAKTADSGLQLGLANVISENRWFEDFPNSLAPGFVIANWRF